MLPSYLPKHKYWSIYASESLTTLHRDTLSFLIFVRILLFLVGSLFYFYSLSPFFLVLSFSLNFNPTMCMNHQRLLPIYHNTIATHASNTITTIFIHTHTYMHPIIHHTQKLNIKKQRRNRASYQHGHSLVTTTTQEKQTQLTPSLKKPYFLLPKEKLLVVLVNNRALLSDLTLCASERIVLRENGDGS